MKLTWKKSLTGLNNLLSDKNHSVLVIVDVQTKLAAAMPEDEINNVLRTSNILLQAAIALEIPVLATEQYPQGLGSTLPEIKSQLPGDLIAVSKTCFSCSDSETFLESLSETGRKQVVLVGMEAHICVLQTAMGLLGRGYQVFIPGDGVCSRSVNHKRNALNRMINNGIQISNVESVLYEWLRDAKNEHFKKLSALIR
ncbi:MAG: hydrolase [Acidiferrobacterales bacterium]